MTVIAFNDAETAIVTRWDSQWSSTPTAYENTKFDPNNLSTAELTTYTNGGPWAELYITELPGYGQISTINETTRRWRVPGIVGVTVNVPLNGGKATLRQLIDTAANVFRAYDANTAGGGHLLFFHPQMTAAGPRDSDKGWFQATMVIKFWFDYDA